MRDAAVVAIAAMASVASGERATTGRDLEREFRFLLAVKLFEIGRVTLGQAAEVAGMSKLRFMDALGELKVPVINLDPDQVADELRGL